MLHLVPHFWSRQHAHAHVCVCVRVCLEGEENDHSLLPEK